MSDRLLNVGQELGRQTACGRFRVAGVPSSDRARPGSPTQLRSVRTCACISDHTLPVTSDEPFAAGWTRLLRSAHDRVVPVRLAPVSTAARRPVRDDELAIAPELALAALTIGAVIGFGRLFDDGRYFGPVLAAAIGSHLVAWAGRRLGLGLPAAALLSAAAGAVVLVWVIEPSTTTLGIPRGASWQRWPTTCVTRGVASATSWRPRPPTEGFVAATVIGTWAAAFLADAAAFRLQATFEAVAPSLTLFVFSSALGPDRHRVRYTVVYLAGLLVFVLVRTATRRAETTSWFAGRRGGGATTIVQGGVGLATAGVVVAALVGPALPGAHSASLVQWRHHDGNNGPRNRVTVSPLVDIQSRLVDQGPTEFFTVKTTGAVPRYWRLTALDDFDGTIWKSSNSYKGAQGELAAGRAEQRPETTLRQDYSIRELSSIWLPAAVRPERLTGQSGARYDEESGSLISSTANGNGLTYTVVSRIPLHRVRPGPGTDDRPRSHSPALPPAAGGFPQRVTTEAERVTASATTPYRKALALQAYFRSSRFSYDDKVSLGTDEKAIVQFLFETKAGFCQQFAGTYAAMARAIGLPARVAVGFVPGRVGPRRRLPRPGATPTWPEVYLAGYGWVPFEPTPAAGRGLPGGDTYAGTPAYRASNTDDPTAPVTSAPPTTAAATAGTPRTATSGGLNVGGGAATATAARRP